MQNVCLYRNSICPLHDCSRRFCPYIQKTVRKICDALLSPVSVLLLPGIRFYTSRNFHIFQLFYYIVNPLCLQSFVPWVPAAADCFPVSASNRDNVFVWALHLPASELSSFCKNAGQLRNFPSCPASDDTRPIFSFFSSVFFWKSPLPLLFRQIQISPIVTSNSISAYPSAPFRIAVTRTVAPGLHFPSCS